MKIPKYYIGDKLILLTTKEEVKIIRVMEKGMAGLKEDIYTVDLYPKKGFTVKAFKPIIEALHKLEKVNECKECPYLVNIIGDKKAYCFVSSQTVHSYINNDTKPSECIKGSELYDKMIKKLKEKEVDIKDGEKTENSIDK